MASRRTRIKGIANIPQRRKTTTANDEESLPQEKPNKSSNESNNPTFNIDDISEEKELHLQPQSSKVDEREVILNSDIAQWNLASNKPSVSKEHNSKTISACDNNSNSNVDTLYYVNSVVKIESGTELQNKPAGIDKSSESKANSNHLENKSKTLLRRKCIKPTISASVINRKAKQKFEIKSVTKPENLIEEQQPINENDEKIEVATISDIPVILEENTLNTIPSALEIRSQEPEHVFITTSKSSTRNDVTLDETYLVPPNEISKPEGHLVKSIRKPMPYLSSNTTFDIEYPPPPPSPNKINRSRIKAIPRLGYRKTSFSASESEDESRRNYNRNRNDSVCSTASGITESVTECMSPQRPKEVSSIIQKKCNRTEQSRKLAEARREFQRRFGNNKPDRQRLTMIDLIFYNPTTNPMNNDVKTKQVENNEEQHTELPSEAPLGDEGENIDDPSNTKEKEDKSDEENEMPVPQIKIGPSGEIILDEKSLVIESKEVKKQREELQKTKVVDGDFDTSYGVYKRQKRSKIWTQNETLRFYKALNTLGTDFTLMCGLFPRRTRRELKMKFKKEERVNRSLINKAITQPCNFNFTELKQEVDMEEKELEELEKLKEDEVKLKKQRKEEKVPKKRKLVKHEDPEGKSVKKQSRAPKIRKAKKPRIRKTIDSVLEDSDADESDIATQSESEDEISMPLRTTRSGRVPKVAKKFDYLETTSIDNVIKDNKVPDVKPETIEPGSIMIFTEKGPNDEPIYKIYMVTPDQNATPLNLTSDIISKAIDFKKGLTAQNIMTISANNTDDEAENNTVESEENNVTIPADENVTTLRRDRKNVSSQNFVSDGDDSTLEESTFTMRADNCE